MNKEKWKEYARLILFLVGIILLIIYLDTILQGVIYFLNVIQPFFIGILLAFILNHPYVYLTNFLRSRFSMKERGSRILSLVLVYLLGFGFIVLLLCLVVPELIGNVKLFIENADQYLMELQVFLNVISKRLGLAMINVSGLIENIQNALGSLSNTMDEMLPQIVNITSNLIGKVASFFIAIVFSVYVLSGKANLLKQAKTVIRIYIPQSIYQHLRNFVLIVIQVFDDYLTGQCKEALILGSLCFMGMLILRLEYAGLISSVIAITALIPLLGAYIGGAVGVLLLMFVSPVKAFIFLVFLVILQQVEGNVIYPKVVGRKVGLPGIWVLIGIVIGGEMAGIWGMFLAVPLTAIVYQLVKQDVRKRILIKER